MKTDLFQSCCHCWVFQICWHMECSTFTASSFRISNSSTGIPSPPLALFVVMLSKAHLTSHSRMSDSRLVINDHDYLGHEDIYFFKLHSDIYCFSLEKHPFLKFHTEKQVKNFTRQINDNLNKNLLKKPHHNNVLGPDHFKSMGPLMKRNQVSLLYSASHFPTTRRRNMFPWLRWHI